MRTTAFLGGVLCLLLSVSVCSSADLSEVSRKQFAALKVKAESGDPGAQNSLAIAYATGNGVGKDATQAVKWFRKAAEAGVSEAQYNLAQSYLTGAGVQKDAAEAMKWLGKAAEKGDDTAQLELARGYHLGNGVKQDDIEALKWLRRSALQGLPTAQRILGGNYLVGNGVTIDDSKAIFWIEKSALQGDADAELLLGKCYANGRGVQVNVVHAYKWLFLSANQGQSEARAAINSLIETMTREQVMRGRKLADEFMPQKEYHAVAGGHVGSGTGFFITQDGYFITNEHVVRQGSTFKIMTTNGPMTAKLVRVDAAEDLALLKVDGQFEALPIVSSQVVRLGDSVTTIGFPFPDVQGITPKLSKGEITALAGERDDPKVFELNLSIGSGHSGGALTDTRGNVIGVVSSGLNGLSSQIVNYAIKSSFLIEFLKASPGVSLKLLPPMAKETKFQDLVQIIERATTLVLVYEGR